MTVGTCKICGEPTSHRFALNCLACYRAKIRVRHRCVDCGKPRAPNAQRCWACYLIATNKVTVRS